MNETSPRTDDAAQIVELPPERPSLRLTDALRLGPVSLAGLEDPADGLLWALAFAGDGSTRPLGWDELDAALDGPDGFLWVHINPSAALARAWLDRTGLLHPESVATIHALDDRTRIHLIGDDLTAVIQDLQVGAERQPWEGTTVRAILDRRVLVTARKRPSQGLRRLRAEVHAGTTFESSVVLFTRLLEHVASALEEQANALAADLDVIEEQVLSNDLERIRRPAVVIRRTAYRLTRLVQVKRASIGTVAERPPTWFLPGEHERFAAVLERIAQVGEELHEIQDRARSALDEVGSRVAEQVNRNTQLLSVVTVIFAPLTLLTGIFGMNTGGLPLTHDPWGTLWLTVMLVVVTAGALWLLRWRRMI